jgi:tRNA pseudouridine38-40 synthase
MRLALGVEYDGAPFEGWQTQPHGRTVQDVLERALAQFAGENLATICAGRTDAGVHARGQVVHVDTTRERDLGAWVRGVNRYLPDEISVRWSRRVADDFHARYAARARHYEYWILNEPVRSPLAARRAGWVFRPLDLEAMRAAAACLTGAHDFSSFRSAQCQAASAERELTRCRIERVGRFLRFDFSANAFLHHMVRNLVGALVAVGTGRQRAAWLAEVLEARDRSRAAPTMAADGLYLAGVDYDARFGLPAPDPAGLPFAAQERNRMPGE